MSNPKFQRTVLQVLLDRVREPRRFLQVLAGPRQTGKTTLARQLQAEAGLASVSASADGPLIEQEAWLTTQWERGRAAARSAGPAGALLVLDEIQKIRRWSEVVKKAWDEDSASGLPLRVLLLGSSPLLLQRGLTESLAGRFEIVPCPHWGYPEMRAAFGLSLDQFLWYGGYPGGAAFLGDQERWARYILDSLIETTLSRDILLMQNVAKPHLLRLLFGLACAYSGQILSYHKMLGQLHDAGNTTTLAHYLDLLTGAGLVTGLSGFSPHRVRQRATSPKLQVLNTALVTATSGLALGEAGADKSFQGRLVETAVGAHLLNQATGGLLEVFYWRERNREVDFVVRKGKKLLAIEVKSGASKGSLPGLDAFGQLHPAAKPLLVGPSGIPVEEFLSAPVSSWF